ncbi:MAG: exodeoxyribonuclease VII large subunit [Holosporales bacterium]|jgi:exodeoxyribonuclease VII large subunit|nr:exodeoxyribonuclease VII large subunit [Holosporales bacterium]
MVEIVPLGNLLRISDDDKVLTVSELSSAIKGQIERNFSSLKMQGEVSGLKKHSSGHTYLSLKDSDSVINAICWRGTKVGFSLEDGMEIVVSGRVTSYPARSQYQFIIEEANIAGEGALLKLLNEKKKQFAILGYFGKKRPLPKFPTIIGIITSATGAAFQDMRHRLEDRYPFCKIILWNVNVQGSEAAAQVASAVKGFNSMTEKRPDILIVARGGGSIEDLWPFNEEVVVKAVFESEIPVVSAIGHETDTTLIDYAADLRAPTPTAAIELSTPVLAEVILKLSENSSRMLVSMQRIIREASSQAVTILRCFASSQFAILAISQKFDDRVDRFFIAIENFIQKETLRLKTKKMISLISYFQLKKQKYLAVSSIFTKLSKIYLVRYFDRFISLSQRLEQGSFKKILDKGFCFIIDSFGKTIETKASFESLKGSELKIHFSDGIVSIDPR